MAGQRVSRPLKIAIVLDKFLPSRGGERYFSFLCEELAKRGHEVHVFAMEAEQTRGLPYGVHTMRVFRHPAWLRTLSLWRCSATTLTAQGFDVVHAVAQCRAATVLNPHGGVEAAYLRQEFASIESPLYRAYRHLSRWLSLRRFLESTLQKRLYASGRLRRVIAISEMVKRDIIDYYAFPGECISVVFNSVDLDAFHPRLCEVHRAQMRTELGLAEEAILLLFAGNNFRLKGVGTLLKALALLTGRFPGSDFRLLVAGRGRPGRYRRLMKKLAISDRVRFAGPVPAMAPYYAAADIYVHPTFYDSCSLTVLEALASGLPAITTRFNGAAQAIRSAEGGKVVDDPADAAELAAAIALYVDPKERAAARSVARSWMEAYPPERNVDETERAYYAALDEPEQGAGAS
jgi:UDP-glucose:(heptosyl)LPS alpha-1,3-glucosyltransferase